MRGEQERALEALYAEIPEIPGCTGACAVACGPIVMFKGEWLRVRRASGGRELKARGLRCPMLSSSGWCTVYSVRPFICRLWGTVREMRCPEGCEPERWLTVEEAHDLLARIGDLVGPQTAGPVGSVENLWEAIALEPRRARLALIEQVKEAHRDHESRP